MHVSAGREAGPRRDSPLPFATPPDTAPRPHAGQGHRLSKATSERHLGIRTAIYRLFEDNEGLEGSSAEAMARRAKPGREICGPGNMENEAWGTGQAIVMRTLPSSPMKSASARRASRRDGLPRARNENTKRRDWFAGRSMPRYTPHATQP